MFSPLTDARYWFRSVAEEARRPAARPTPFGPRGALVLTDGSAVELDYTSRDDERKMSGIQPKQVIGIGWRDRHVGVWRVTVRGMRVSKHEADGATLQDAVSAAIDKYYVEEAAEAALVADPITHLTRELSRHDWWHMMSDSYGTVAAGERHMQDILHIAAKCPPDTVRALWAQYAPAGFACPT